MNAFEDKRLSVGQGRKVRIVNHHNQWLVGKEGFLIGKHRFHYAYEVWLQREQFSVIVSWNQIVPANELVISWMDIFTVHWMVWWHNAAVKLRGLLSQ